MIHYHDLVYSVPQAFIEEDEYSPNFSLDEEPWQQRLFFDVFSKITLWRDDSEAFPLKIPILTVDEDFGQMRLSLITTQQVSLWL